MSDISNIEAEVYVGTHNHYNDGDLYGDWFNLMEWDDYEDFMEAVEEYFEEEVEKYGELEYMIQDTSHDNSVVEEFLGSFSTIEKFYELLEELESSSVDPEVAFAYLGYFGFNVNTDLSGDLKDAQNKYYGYFEGTEKEVYVKIAENEIDNGLLEIPSHIENYFDKESYGEDIARDKSSFNGYYFND